MPDNEQKPGQIPKEHVQKSAGRGNENKTGGDDNLPKLRTMKHDAARYLKDRNLSFLDLVAEEHDYAQKRSKKFEYRENITEKTWFWGVITLVVLVMLAAGGYAAYVALLTTDTLPGTEAPPARAFITTEEREIITIRENDRAGLFSKLEAARRTRLPSRSIKHVVVRIESFGGTVRFATANDFFSIADFKLPSGLADNLNDAFDILIYYRSDGADIALILEPKNKERAFAQMLAWEDTILLDFRSLYFDNEVTQPLQLFSDKIIRNIDARTIAVPGADTFSYAFFANRLLVIATAEDFLEVAIGRLLAAPPR